MAVNVYTLCESIIDVDGKKHKIYPCPLIDIPEVAAYVAKVNPDFIFASFLLPDLDDEGAVKRDDETGKIIYGRSAVDELVSVVEIALRHKETPEQIMQWMDIGLGQQIVETLIGMSQIKKKIK